jgi:hypothetical protein
VGRGGAQSTRRVHVRFGCPPAPPAHVETLAAAAAAAAGIVGGIVGGGIVGGGGGVSSVMGALVAAQTELETERSVHQVGL